MPAGAPGTWAGGLQSRFENVKVTVSNYALLSLHVLSATLPRGCVS